MSGNWILAINTEPSIEPITLTDLREHCRIDHTADDAYLLRRITAARRQIERRLNRQLITATWDLTLDQFHDELALPKPPLQSVTQVQYRDTADGTLQTLSTDVYDVDTGSEPGVIRLAYAQSWPSHRATWDAIQIRFVAGYGDSRSDVPDDIKTAMEMLIDHWYDNREAALPGMAFQEVPYGYDAILSPYRIHGAL